MKDANRRAAVLEAIRAKTAINTSSRKAAREALIAEGIYTQTGTLRAEFRPKLKPKTGSKQKSGAN